MASTFRLEAMDCTAEEHLVRMRLADLAEVRRVDVDLGARTVDVLHETDPDLVLEALDELGLRASHVRDRPGGTSVPIPPADPAITRSAERRALRVAFGLNATLFVLEVTVGLVVSSAGLVADGLDMGADAVVYALSLVAVTAAVAHRRRLAAASGWLQLGLAVTGLAEVVRRLLVGGETPDATSMAVVSLVALAANVATLAVLRGVRDGGVHLRASWIFTANDVWVNLLVIAAAAAVAVLDVAVPDLVVGGAIFAIVANGARRILGLARAES